MTHVAACIENACSPLKVLDHLVKNCTQNAFIEDQGDILLILIKCHLQADEIHHRGHHIN